MTTPNQIPVDQSDPRRCYTSQAYGMSYMGMAKETGRLGGNSRLVASYAVQIPLYIPDLADTDPLEWILPRNVFLTQYSVARAAGATSAVSITGYDEAGNDTVLAAAANLAAIAAPVNFTNLMEASDTDEYLIEIVSDGAGSGSGILVLSGAVIPTAWK